MKISVLTPTYNRAESLEKLYTSLVVNSNSNIQFEWLVMDDGSTDRTKIVVENFIKQNIVDIKYFYQENQGKMAAVNNLMKEVTGDIVFTCDSDDYLVTGAFDIIKKYADKLLNDETVYALAFLKKSEHGKISGRKFSESLHRSDMFSLYFRENMTGEKVLVFKTEIRKKFKHELEADEKFVTESRMYHKMDRDYDIIGINEALEIGDYRSDGYTKNILATFTNYPLGYYMYFKEILEKDFAGVSFSKRMYVYKHYILFTYLADQKLNINNINGTFNKLMVLLLWAPGTIIAKKKFNNNQEK
jgi:glycosyltransferase involved in cell wall biosynthesis